MYFERIKIVKINHEEYNLGIGMNRFDKIVLKKQIYALHIEIVRTTVVPAIARPSNAPSTQKHFGSIQCLGVGNTFLWVCGAVLRLNVSPIKRNAIPDANSPLSLRRKGRCWRATQSPRVRVRLT